VIVRCSWVILAVAFVAAGLAPGAASGEPALHECQKPLVTGVEVYGLHRVSATRACPVALALFKWESSGDHARVLYGCHRPAPEAAGNPYLKLHSFHGWRLSLAGPEKLFTMSRGKRSFRVTGTDFPLNCT
jgi:hypothetical protein